MAANIFTVRNAMFDCGLNDHNLFQQRTQAQRFATDIFGDDFIIVRNKTIEELHANIKMFHNLTQVQGQIRLTPITVTKLQAFLFWTQEMDWYGHDPSMEAFPVQRTGELSNRIRLHKKFINDAKTMIDISKPKDFAANKDWEEWQVTLVANLIVIPGQSGVPLSHAIRENDNPTFQPQTDFLDEYVNEAPLHGPTFDNDNTKVFGIIKSLIVENERAQSIIQALNDNGNGRRAYLELERHYWGAGPQSIDILRFHLT